MYRIPSDKEALAIKLFLSGASSRSVATDAGINKNTAWTLGRSLKEAFGTIYCPCGKVAGHKAWCGNMMQRYGIPWRSQIKDVTSFNIYIPSRPRYERPDIPNERKTEIPLLVNRRYVRSLDAPMFDVDESGHTFFKNELTMTPFEIVCLNEERLMENKYESRAWRIAEWERWCERQTSAFQIT